MSPFLPKVSHKSNQKTLQVSKTLKLQEDETLKAYYKKYPGDMNPADLSKHIKDSVYEDESKTLIAEIASDTKRSAVGLAKKARSFIGQEKKKYPIYEFKKIDISNLPVYDKPVSVKLPPKPKYIIIGEDETINLEEGNSDGILADESVKISLKKPSWLKKEKRGKNLPPEKA